MNAAPSLSSVRVTLYRVSPPGVFGVEVRNRSTDPKRRVFVRAEGTPGEVLPFARCARVAVRRMKGDELRAYLSNLSQSWEQWRARKRAAA